MKTIYIVNEMNGGIEMCFISKFIAEIYIKKNELKTGKKYELSTVLLHTNKSETIEELEKLGLI